MQTNATASICNESLNLTADDWLLVDANGRYGTSCRPLRLGNSRNQRQSIRGHRVPTVPGEGVWKLGSHGSTVTH